MKINLPITFSQNDPLWKGTTLGTKGTIGAYGCLMTDAAMVACYFGSNETPLTLNQKLLNNGGYLNGNLFVWTAFATIFGLKYSTQFSNSNNLTKTNMDQIRGAIDKGFPVFLQIDTIPSTSDLDEHWILAIDYDGDDFIIQDPWDGATKRITSWGVIPQKLIYAWCWYEGNITANASTGGCLLENTADNQKTFQKLVHNSDQWDKTVTDLKPGSEPKSTQFEDIQAVVSGIKSRSTDLEKQLTESVVNLEKANAEILNQKDKVANVEDKCQTDLQLKEAEISALIEKGRVDAKTMESYQGTIGDLQGKLKEAQKAGGAKDLTITEYKTKLSACEKGVKTSSLWTAIMNFLKGTSVVVKQ